MTHILESQFHTHYLEFSERILDSWYNKKMKSLLNLSNIAPSSEIVKEGYIRALKNYSCLRDEGKIDGAFQEIGLEIPTLSKEEIENIHFSLFDGTSSHSIHKMGSLYRTTGILPKLPEGKVQEFYKKELCSKKYVDLDNLLLLKELTRINPENLDETELSIAFLNVATSNRDLKNSAEDLESLVGKKYIPKKSFIQRKHLELLKEKDSNGYYKDYNSKLLEEYFGVSPSNEVLSEVFQHFITNKDCKHISYLANKYQYDCTREMRDGYRNLVTERNEFGTVNGFGYLIPFKNETGIQHDFDEDFIQKTYLDLINEEYFSDLKTFIEFTELPVSENIIQTGYETFASQGKLDMIADLKEISGIEPNERIYEIFNHGLLNNFKEEKKPKFSLKSLFTRK